MHAVALPAPSLETLYPPNLGHDYFVGAAQQSFAPDAGAAHAGNRWWLAEHALLAYADSGFIERNLRPLGYALELLQPSGHNSFAYLAQAADHRVLAVRGTQVYKSGDPLPKLGAVARDWATDAHVQKQPWAGGGAVHAGFLKALAALWPRLSELLGQAGPPLYCTGHSLGGALAVLAAARWQHAARPARVSVVTFGQPRIGDAGFAESLAGLDYFRVVHPRDLVPNVPPLNLGFVDAGSRLQLPPVITRRGQAGWRELPQLLSFSMGALTPVGLLEHAPLYYALQCRNLAAAA